MLLTQLTIRNFKLFHDVVVELGQSVVLIGPNNSGKTTALQALALWHVGLQKWLEKRGVDSKATKRTGVTINRRDLIAIPVPYANLLWRDLHVRNVRRENGKNVTTNIRVDIIVEGVTAGKAWRCGLEFDYANEESFYCRPLRLDDVSQPERMTIPVEAHGVKTAFLPPMSGLAANEPRLDVGRINVLIGEGQTAQVLRNLCYQLWMTENQGENTNWSRLQNEMRRFFGVQLRPPDYITERGEITMVYEDQYGIQLDLAASGRGLQQTTLLLAYLYSNPGSVLLLDEPDAHLEILRQRQIYQLLTETAKEQGSQIIAASHSEVVLNEAAGRDVVVAFVGKPHRIDERGGRAQVVKALKDIGYDQYYQAEQMGWVLYLEGASDWMILQTLARKLDHTEAIEVLSRPFVHYVGTNLPQRARDHFYGLREAKPNFVGMALFDRLDKALGGREGALVETMWRKREIENYICTESVLLRYAESNALSPKREFLPMFDQPEIERYRAAMQQAIEDVTKALETLDSPPAWSDDLKVSDDFLRPVFRNYFRALSLPNLMNKSDYHILADHLQPDEIDAEVREKLDQIVAVAHSAQPETDES